MRPPVLIIEGSRVVAKLLKRQIVADLDMPVNLAHSRDEALDRIQTLDPAPIAAVLDLELPDDPAEEVLEALQAAKLPIIALTGSCDAESRVRILDRCFVDYYLKEVQGISGVIEMLRRLEKNPTTRILVVDDSRTFRMLVRQLLEVHCFDILEAGDGQEGLEVLEANPDVSLVLTDFEMPRVDGLALVSKLRSMHNRGVVATIGISAQGNSAMSAMFLKHGADDFLTKPFEKEEFYCRVYRSIAIVEHIRKIEQAAYTDKLTSLSNRQHFFKLAPPLYEEAVSDGRNLATAMIDIDHFKVVNDTYGHAGGDIALQNMAALMTNMLGDMEVVARFGGEEFCAFGVGLHRDRAVEIFEDLRRAVEASVSVFNDQEIRFTISVGLTFSACSSLDSAINKADELLYQAKKQGRNRVLVQPGKGS